MPNLQSINGGVLLPQPAFPKWLVAIFILGAAGVLAGGAIFYRIQERHLRNDVERNLAAIVKLKVEAINDWRRDLLGDANLLAENNVLKAAIAEGAVDTAPVRHAITVFRTFSRYQEVLLVGSTGQVQVSSSGRLRSLTGEELSTLRRVVSTGQKSLTEIFSAPETGTPRLSVILPLAGIPREKQEYVAAIVLMVDPADYLYPLIQTWPVFSNSAETLLVRREGDHVLYLNNLRHMTNAALKLTLPLTRSDLPAVRALSGYQGVVEGRDYRGIPVLAISAPISGSSWFLVGKMDRSEALAGWHFRARVILGALVILLAGLSLAILLIWQIRQKAYYRAAYKVEEKLRESEAIFSSFMEHSPIYVFFKDKNGRPLRLSKNFQQMLGMPVEEAIGKPMDELFPPELARRMMEDDLRILNEGHKVEVTEEFNGRIYETTKFPIFKDGRPELLAGFTVDITERKQAEALLRKSEERYRSVVEAAADAIFTVDPDGRFMSLNSAFERFTGLPVRDWLGRSFEPLIHPDDLPLALDRLQRALKGEPGTPFELRIRHLDQNDRLGEFSIIPQFHEGRVEYVLGFGRDITESRKLQQKFLQSQKMETVGRLAGGVAHDFNNILQAIIGYSQLLLDETPPTDPRRSDMEEVLHNGERAAALTRQLLAFSRRQMLQPRPTDLVRLIGDLARMLERLLGENMNLKQEHLPGRWLAKVDPGQIDQILMNLAVNARDAMPQGGTLTIRTENVNVAAKDLQDHPEGRVGNFICMSVSDTGTGMTPEVRANLFEPFFTTKGIGKGSGLGLATVYGIVKQHDGWIEVASQEGRGTTFRIYLPVALESVPEKVKPSPPELSPGHRERILVVEDSPQVGRLICEMLSRGGYQVFLAENCVEALAVCDARIALIISDVLLPDGNGVDLVERLQRQFPGMKCILCSAYSDVHERWPEIAGRGWIFLNKPVLQDDLLVAVARTLGKA